MRGAGVLQSLLLLPGVGLHTLALSQLNLPFSKFLISRFSQHLVFSLILIWSLLALTIRIPIILKILSLIILQLDLLILFPLLLSSIILILFFPFSQSNLPFSKILLSLISSFLIFIIVSLLSLPFSPN